MTATPRAPLKPLGSIRGCLGLAFSASSLAVITPVESRTHLIAILGLLLVKEAS